MRQKKRPPGWTKTRRNGGGYEAPYNKVHYTMNAGRMQAEISAAVESGVET